MKKQRGKHLLLGALLGGIVVASAPPGVLADDCIAIGGQLIAGECRISGTLQLAGSYTFDETLRILSGGSIQIPALNPGPNFLSLTTVDSIILDPGAKITGDNSASCNSGNPKVNGVGATIVLTADSDNDLTGDVLISGPAAPNPRAQVTSNGKCTGGDIEIRGTVVTVDGLVQSRGRASGVGQTDAGGGMITTIAKCDLTVTGEVTSQGDDPGPDLVHLEGGCAVKISGLVQSIGKAHGTNVINHCTIDHPDKDPLSIACVEVWAGDSLVIDATANTIPPPGVSADRTKTSRTSWIDLFARGPISIFGKTTGSDFAVHANGLDGSNDFGGIIQIISTDPTVGSVTASGNAVQANAEKKGGHGGSITTKAQVDTLLNTAVLEAQGQQSGNSPTPSAGHIVGKAADGQLLWQNGVGDVSTNNAAFLGTITLTACTAANITGTTFLGVPLPVVPITGDCGDDLLAELLAVQPYVNLPPCLCGNIRKCVCIDSATVSGTTLTLEGCQFQLPASNPADPPINNLPVIGLAPACTDSPTCTVPFTPTSATTGTADLTQASPAGCATGPLVIVAGFPDGSGNSPFSYACTVIPTLFP